MRPGTSLQKYKTICEFMCLYATLRFYQLALLLGTTGAIVTAPLTSTTIRASPALAAVLKLGGSAIALALTIMEFRASSYWHRMHDRANVLCEALDYQPFPISSRWNPLTTTGGILPARLYHWPVDDEPVHPFCRAGVDGEASSAAAARRG